MGFFDEFNTDVADVPAQSSGPEAGNYEAKIINAEIRLDIYKSHEKGNLPAGRPVPRFLCVDIKDVKEDWRYPKTMSFELPARPAPWDTEDVYTIFKDNKTLSEHETNMGHMSKLKTFLLSAGVAEEDVNSVNPQDLIGLTGIVTLTVKGKYTNATKFKAIGADNAGSVEMPKPAAATAGSFEPTHKW